MSERRRDSSAWPELVADPETEQLTQLTSILAEADGPADEAGAWPARLWQIVTDAGAPLWSLPRELGGSECDRATLAERYARMAEGSLTAAFILTQHDAAVRRLLPAADRPSAAHWLREIAAGRAFTTVGISHLTTSRRYGAQALAASERIGGGYRLKGMIPWVTAAERAQVLVTGATLDDGRQLLLAVPTDRPGLTVRPAFPLAALQASCTAEVACEDVEVTESEVLAGPLNEVLSSPSAAGTGGLETSALALGQAHAALVALQAETPKHDELAEPVEALADAWHQLWLDLIAAAQGRDDAPSSAQIRSQANALVLRLTQAHLTARKGTGFLRTDPAQRWARQALFFLVWSCPGPVARAAIRDLAGLCAT
ncbi:MAG TPA: acyl-CoA dehydrogenase family protein [Isosphaeraceae bacterium]|jgi:alkylation response protein AidB-like acyl-CoA dehydrogenase|nr:acyl-CoA dehydrogenase family protein [Isosphaeraceae bacterium]